MCCLTTGVGVDGEDERPEAVEETGERGQKSGRGRGRPRMLFLRWQGSALLNSECRGQVCLYLYLLLRRVPQIAGLKS